MTNFRYVPTDEQIRSYYGELIQAFKERDINETNYHEDIALLMAHINKLLTQEDTVNKVDNLDLERWKITLDTIKLKATLIKEQRLHTERLEKSEERRMKLNSIPIEDFKSAITSIVHIVCKYVPTSQVTGVIADLNEVIQKCTPTEAR